jgi:glutamate-1-semialdehyde 2,1-aminomutase
MSRVVFVFQQADPIFQVTKRFYPSGIELVRFTNSGTEANTMALAAAVAYTGRTKVLAFKNGYHGGTLSFPLTSNKINTNLPHDFILAPYNNISGTQTILDSLPKDSLAAIIVESIQGSGGAIPGNEDFLHFLNTSANKLGALFIVDEVITSRLSYHGLSSELSLTPDLVTLGKWVGGGMTFGAFGGRKRVMSMFDPRDGVLAHSGTFNNNVVTMAAGCTGIDLYNEAEVKRLNALGDSLRTGLQAILLRYQINQEQPATFKPCPQKNELESPFTGTQCFISTPDTALSVESLSLSDPRNTKSKIAHHSRKGGMWVSGRGSIMNVHFSGESEKSLQSIFWHYMLERGIYLAQRGFVALNIETNENHVEKFLKAAEGFVGMYQGGMGRCHIERNSSNPRETT